MRQRRKDFLAGAMGRTSTFVVRSHTNLRSYIYESDSEFMDASALRNFDSLDFIFIDGDANFKPWSRHSRQLTILLKMAIMTQSAASWPLLACKHWCTS